MAAPKREMVCDPRKIQVPTLPKCGMAPLISQWYHGRVLLGGGGEKIRAAVLLKPSDLPPSTKKTATTETCRARNRYSEACHFMTFLERAIVANTSDVTRGYSLPPAQSDVPKMFAHVQTILEHCSRHSTRRYDTRKQKGWSTHLKDVRKWLQQGGYGGRGALAKHVLEVELDTDDGNPPQTE